MALLEINKSVNVNTSEECFKFYKAFCRSEQNTSNYAVFPKLSNLYVLCASIGYHLGTRTQLINPVRCTRSEHISTTEEMPTLVAIAYADPNEGHDLSLFGDIKKIFSICDEYAETGVRFLMEQYPFKNIYSNGEVYNNEKDLEFSILMKIKELKENFAEQLI